jgi:uncharacterized membrane protein
MILEGVRQEKKLTGLLNAIHFVGETLSKDFPIRPCDVNELPNSVVVKY